MLYLSRDASIHYFIYWTPTYIYLITIMIMFTYLSKKSLAFSLSIGILTLLWHFANIALYISFKEWGDMPSAIHASSTAVLIWWIEAFLNFILIAAQLDLIFAKNTYCPLTDKGID